MPVTVVVPDVPSRAGNAPVDATPAGPPEIPFSTTDLSAGSYLMRLQDPDQGQTREPERVK
ncbi:hypothetical protein GCM10022408_31110 [Hymenobacter fastidiosus]|uniref:T9SS type A sorting domain-containing protein n=1 Tax=Hymenobacter fastidiosus TaxID=486264 RepID=A0ABP7SRQ7_9BACT